MPNPSNSATTVDPVRWKSLYESPSFQALIRSKRRFIAPATAFFIAYYFALPVLVGYFPELMKTRVWGPVNVAYVFALSQFVMAWLLAWVYLSVAAKFDASAKDVLEQRGAAE